MVIEDDEFDAALAELSQRLVFAFRGGDREGEFAYGPQMVRDQHPLGAIIFHMQEFQGTRHERIS